MEKVQVLSGGFAKRRRDVVDRNGVCGQVVLAQPDARHVPAPSAVAADWCFRHPAAGRANEQDACASNAGTLLIGTVISGPRFAHGHERRGVELSHTHVALRGNDGRRYDIAIDDVFADGYDQAGESVPAPLSRIKAGDRLEVCGKRYASGGLGMDWVHTSCGDPPKPDKPDGWVKVLGPDGTPGPNLESNRKYCRTMAAALTQSL